MIMANECRSSDCGSVFLAFVMGAAIGGGLALLAAPSSGKETRDKIREMADEAGDRIKKMSDDAQTRIRETIQEGKETLQEKKDLIKSAVEAGKEAMEAERSKHQEQPA
jgi:gas vesicle protein